MLGTLKEHRMRHTGERPHKCQHCDASFINSTGLKNHSAKHTGIRPHKCQICGKMFTKSYGLKMHSLSHSKDKPFVCEVITKSIFGNFPFRKLWNLNPYLVSFTLLLIHLSIRSTAIALAVSYIKPYFRLFLLSWC